MFYAYSITPWSFFLWKNKLAFILSQPKITLNIGWYSMDAMVNFAGEIYKVENKK